MVERALTYPFKESGKLRVIIGATLVAFSWAILPFILLVGYYIQTLTFASTGREDPPAFRNPISLLKVGTIGSVIMFTYSGFFIAPGILVLAGLSPYIASTVGTVELFLNIFAGAIMLFTIIMALILPVALARYGRNGEFKAAYEPAEMYALLRTRAVLKAIISTVLFTVAVFIAVGIFFAITLGFGVVLAPAILFWYIMVTAYFYGTGIGEATGTVMNVNYEDIVEEIKGTDNTTVNSTEDDTSPGTD